MGHVFPCTEQGILDAIAEGGGPHTFACDGPITVATKAEIVIDNDVILDGGGNLTVDGNEEHRVFSVPEGTTAELRRFVVTNGLTARGEPGGGIHNSGTLALTNIDVSRNTGDHNGGGINNDGTLTLTDSTVSGNRGGSGGGLYNIGTLTLNNSTVSGNTTPTCGGGIDNDRELTVTNSTISGNTADNCGGGIFNEGALTMTSSTMAANSAPNGDAFGTGSPRSERDYATMLVNTLIQGDCASHQPVTSGGYNLESPGNTCGFHQEGDQANVTAEQLNLGPLQDNGGPTMTQALGAGSGAIDRIPAVDCEVITDQRGEPRPGGPMCDVGSFEVHPEP
jgi:hypothetical protein